MMYQKIIHISCSLFFTLLGIRLVWMGMLSEIYALSLFPRLALMLIFTGLALIVVAFGIFKQFRWAKRTAATITLLIAIILPVGIFSPFIGGIFFVFGSELSTISKTLLWLVPLEALLLAVVFFIDPKKEKDLTKMST